VRADDTGEVRVRVQRELENLAGVQVNHDLAGPDQDKVPARIAQRKHECHSDHP
jgi:hypothetical protein